MSKIEKPRSKFFKKKFNNKKPGLDVNQRGFLCSCNNREKDCIRESYNLLNKYADVLYPCAETTALTKADCDESKLQEVPSIEDDLQNELNELRSEKRDVKRFQVLESGAKNFLFIKTTLEDPVQLANKIVSEIAEKKSQETRFLLRLIPVEVTCKAFVKDIENAFEILAEKYFTKDATSFSIIFNHRNNNCLSRDEVIKAVADIVFAKRSDHKVNLKEADVSIVIEVIRGIALLAVVPDFIKYKKFNLLAICDVPDEGEATKDVLNKQEENKVKKELEEETSNVEEHTDINSEEILK